MSRPDGAPFWGESIQADPYAFNVTGSVLPFVPGNPTFGTPDHASASPIVFRGPLNHSAPSATMHSGDAIQITAATTGYAYLKAGDTGIEPLWVVEVLSGTGTLVLSQTLDYSTNANLVTTPTALGSISVDGPGTYTLPALGVTVDLILSRTKLPIATIACTSGTVEVQQVKMRLWPAGGPLGGLIGRQTDPPESVEANRYRVVENATGFDEETTLDYDLVWNAAWNDARAHVAADFGIDGSLAGYDHGNALYGTYSTNIYNGFDVTRATVELGRQSMWFIRPNPEDFTPDPAGVDGVDYIRHPDEVYQDPAGFGTYDAPPVLSWASVVLNLTASAEGSPPDGENNTVGYLDIGTGAAPVILGSIQLEFNTVGMDGGGVTVPSWPGSDGVMPLTFPDSPVVRLTARHEYLTSSNPAIHGSGAGSVFNPLTAGGQAGGPVTSDDGTPVKWVVTFSPFSFWVPGPARTTLPLRQFPRNDGLRGGPAGVTPSSRQAGRGNGYL